MPEGRIDVDIFRADSLPMGLPQSTQEQAKRNNRDDAAHDGTRRAICAENDTVLLDISLFI